MFGASSIHLHAQRPVRVGQMGGKRRYEEGKLGTRSRTYPPIGRRLRVIKGFMRLCPFEVQNND